MVRFHFECHGTTIVPVSRESNASKYGKVPGAANRCENVSPGRGGGEPNGLVKPSFDGRGHGVLAAVPIHPRDRGADGRREHRRGILGGSDHDPGDLFRRGLDRDDVAKGCSLY